MAHEADHGRRTSSRRRRSARGRALRITAWGVATVLLLATAAVGCLYLKLNGNIRGIDINALLGRDRPRDVDNGSMDILVLGSDSRSGANAKAGGGQDDGTARSDTAMIVHVYPGHRRASVVSIPRDTLVDRPSCAKPGGGTAPAVSNEMFNEAYAVGGPACTVKTVETMTGIRMDHYIEIDFTGFQRLIDALGGVSVTTSRAISDNESHLHLPAGTHHLNGKQALGLVRTRHGVGDGSDLGRIRLQQAFLKALVDRVDSIGVLGSPARLYKIASTATGAITTDSELASVKKLVNLGESLKDLGSRHISMVTMPVRYDPADPNRVVPLTAQTERVWAALRADRPIPRSATKGSAGDEVDTGGVVRSTPQARDGGAE
ncbi:LCP family protein [Streptomyces sp. MI02-7b]|uniref:LCP family protein n=1 Tax=Streptomyces sp. MI02-7b TaxID=462941 RepID=UPI0029AC1CCD|nr:LCP family protein [Streptomyces sp. MI02-7b]MDX3073230.1 LCP family protein [Streptomyces sp. MI02-7b]